MAQDPPRTDNFNPEKKQEFTVYIDTGGPELTPVLHHHPREQMIHYGGTGYYHVCEHGGAWVYRS
jgi:hypothetical protein